MNVARLSPNHARSTGAAFAYLAAVCSALTRVRDAGASSGATIAAVRKCLRSMLASMTLDFARATDAIINMTI